ncbi:MAG TPA: type I-B CRISPR-associated protein Cas7/Cst2/DevR [Alphaproteobacteria bacterium]|nr:type I-B CRISPR-associated protein Cas7/Cst2/DevR [Alphaproteobacteria bacterium]
MAYPVLTGAVLIEANGAALNNAGQDQGSRTDNAIVVKQARLGRLRYPYVSGQAWRRWWREVLYADFGWPPSQVTVIQRPQQAFTAGDPIAYEEDDLFGYMVARRRATRGRGSRSSETSDSEAGEAATESGRGTFRRVSPLKNSLLISVLPNVIERDFGHFTRNLPPDADPLLYESEHYTTCLQGVFTVSLTEAGSFEVGEMHDLSDEVLRSHQDQLQSLTERRYRLLVEHRIKRVQDVVRALARLRGGAHLARNLSDVTPVVALIGFLDGGNAPFQRLFAADSNYERVNLNLERLRSILHDYRDRLLAPSGTKAIFFGYRPTVLGNEEVILNTLNTDEIFRDHVAVSGTPQQALEAAAAAVKAVFEQYVA